MLEVRDITNDVAAKFFLNDPKLAYLGCADDVLVKLYYTQDYEPQEMSQLKGIFDSGQLIMLMKYEFFTTVALNIHCYLSSSLQGRGYFGELVTFIIAWIKQEMPQVTKLLVMTPDPCSHIQAMANRYGFIKEGHLKNVVVWRQQTVDLIIYGMEI